jgi:hypothetical protein
MDLNLSRRKNTIVCRKLLHVPFSAGSAADCALDRPQRVHFARSLYVEHYALEALHTVNLIE